MGAAESTPEDEAATATSAASTSTSTPPPDLDSFDVSGWLILHIQPSSPCDSQGLVPYFDLITHVNGHPLTSHESSLLAHIRPHTSISLTVFSLSLLSPRTLSITPRPHSGEGLLGLLIRHDSLSSSTPVECLHVLRVHPHSPASDADLRAGHDFLLGGDRVAFKAWPQFDAWLQRDPAPTTPSSVWVFNRHTWRVREVHLRLRKGWGGEGTLGADLAHGWKHRLPVWDDGRRRPVRVERRSGVGLGRPSQRGLVAEDGQVLLHMPLQEGKEGEWVPLLTIRVREPGEDAEEVYVPTTPAAASAPMPAKAPAPAPATATAANHNAGHAHDHAAHGHSHAHGEHGHSHGSHSQGAGAPAVAASTQGSGAGYSAATAATSTAVRAAGSAPAPAAPAAVPGSAGTGKKAITAQLPRSRESSPTLPPAAAAAPAASAFAPLPQSAVFAAHGGPPVMGVPFPSLAPNTAAFNPAVRGGQALPDFT